MKGDSILQLKLHSNLAVSSKQLSMELIKVEK